jgi:hypothetical protein
VGGPTVAAVGSAEDWGIFDGRPGSIALSDMGSHSHNAHKGTNAC